MNADGHRIVPATTLRFGRVAVLMAARNGDLFIRQQLESIAAQDVDQIDLWVSDDGSSDRTRRIVGEFGGRWGKGKITLLDGPRMGFAENYRSLMTRGDIEADYFAFCDQDDLWDADKLSTAINALASVQDDRPALFCSRTRLISEGGEVMGHSSLFQRPPSFRNALVQSIAGGNTMVMNRAARDLMLEASRRTAFVSHDWWCYQMISGAGGVVLYSAESKIGYRQHGSNLVGENNSWRARIFRMHFMLAGRLQDWNEQNVAALNHCRDLLTPDARLALRLFSEARKSSPFKRVAALMRSGVYRQTRMEHWGLMAACILRRL